MKITRFYKKQGFIRRFKKTPKTIDLNKLTKRKELLKHLFEVSNKLYETQLKWLIVLTALVFPVSALFPSLFEEIGPGITFIFASFITLIFWFLSSSVKQKNDKIKNYYFTNKECKIWATDENEDRINIMFDDKKINIEKTLLPFSVIDSIQIINYDNFKYINPTNESTTENETQLSNNQEKTKASKINQLKIDVSQKYVSGNTYNLPLLILFFTLCLPLGVAVAVIYAYLIWYIPFPYLNFIISAIIGAVIGLLFPIKMSKCTNPKIAFISCLIFTTICYYFGWITWLELYMNRDVAVELARVKNLSYSKFDQIIYLISNPSTVINNLYAIAQTGYFSAFSYTPKGIILYFIWFVEFIIIFFFSIFIACDKSTEPYNIEKKRWLKSFKIQIKHITHLDLLHQAIVNNDKTYFDNLTFSEKKVNYTEFETWCLNDEQAFVTIKNFIKRDEKKGNNEEYELVKYAKISPEILNSLKMKLSNNEINENK